jgi:hypothetical protein
MNVDIKGYDALIKKLIDGEPLTDEERERYKQYNAYRNQQIRKVLDMDKKQAEAYVKDLLNKMPKSETFAHSPHEIKAYVMGYLYGQFGPFILTDKLKTIKKDDVFKWVDEYIDKVFPYSTTTQGLLPNQLRQTGKRTGSNIREKDTLVFNGEKVKLAYFESDKYNGVAMTVPMQKVNAMFQEGLCKQLPTDLKQLGKITLEELEHYANVTITLDEYMRLTGVKDKKEARATIKEACDRLYHISFIVGAEGKTYRGRLFSAQVEPAYGGKFTMKFTPDYLRYCATIRPADFHKGLYQLRGKYNPYSWGLGHKLWSYFIMNRGKARASRISIKSLIGAVPDLPTYEEVISENRTISQRIIEPFERDMEELKRVGYLISWEYCNGRGAPLTDDQLARMDYNTWIKLYISFVLNLPSQEKYIEAHKKKTTRKKKKKDE